MSPSPSKGCCPCFGGILNFAFFQNRYGRIKIAEIISGFLCLGLLIMNDDVGSLLKETSIHGLTLIVLPSITINIILIGIYVLSKRNEDLLRQSLIELFFNLVASCIFIIATTIAVFVLYKERDINYHPISLVIFGLISGLLHLIDTYFAVSYKQK